VHTKSQLGWLNLLQLPIPSPPVTAKQRVVIILGSDTGHGLNRIMDTAPTRHFTC